MRQIDFIVFHCTATLQNASVESIQRYWRDVMKWNDPGYYLIIKPNGEKVYLSTIDKPTNGVAGHNKNSIHISYIGGVDRDGKPVDNRTEAQKKTMYEEAKILKAKFPKAIFKGHRDFEGVKKACPSFEVSEWVKQVGL